MTHLIAEPHAQYEFSQIHPHEAVAAHSFLERAATEHIFPRTQEDMRRYADAGELFGVKTTHDGEFIALCYVTLDDDTDRWELGGLLVDNAHLHAGIGRFIARMSLAITVAYNDPFKYGQRVIAHVHELNDRPRRLLTQVGFVLTPEKEELPPEIAPASMARNAEGRVIGDVFEFIRDELPKLSRWISQEFDGTFGPGRPSVELNLVRGPKLSHIRTTLSEIAERVANESR